MIPNYLYLYIVLSLLVTTNCRNIFRKQPNSNKLKDFIKCAIEKINIGNITLENISSLIINPQKINFKKYQEIFTDNYKKINYCIGKGTIPYFPDGTKIINMNVIIKEKYDWTKFISCLKEQTSKLKDSLIQKLIEFIKEGNYYDALREEFKLRIKGNFIIKQCIAMKTKPLLSL